MQKGSHYFFLTVFFSKHSQTGILVCGWLTLILESKKSNAATVWTPTQNSRLKRLNLPVNPWTELISVTLLHVLSISPHLLTSPVHSSPPLPRTTSCGATLRGWTASAPRPPCACSTAPPPTRRTASATMWGRPPSCWTACCSMRASRRVLNSQPWRTQNSMR